MNSPDEGSVLTESALELALLNGCVKRMVLINKKAKIVFVVALIVKNYPKCRILKEKRKLFKTFQHLFFSRGLKEDQEKISISDFIQIRQ